MRTFVFATVALLVAVGIPQWAGWRFSRRLRTRFGRYWAWSLGAGVSCAIAWTLLWLCLAWWYTGNPTAPDRDDVEGVLLLYLGVVFGSTINVVIGAVASGILEVVRTGRHGERFGADLERP
jgi:hypothetical protein